MRLAYENMRGAYIEVSKLYKWPQFDEIPTGHRHWPQDPPAEWWRPEEVNVTMHAVAEIVRYVHTRWSKLWMTRYKLAPTSGNAAASSTTAASSPVDEVAAAVNELDLAGARASRPDLDASPATAEEEQQQTPSSSSSSIEDVLPSAPPAGPLIRTRSVEPLTAAEEEAAAEAEQDTMVDFERSSATMREIASEEQKQE